jgi:hypothetical protein
MLKPGTLGCQRKAILTLKQEKELEKLRAQAQRDIEGFKQELRR